VTTTALRSRMAHRLARHSASVNRRSDESVPLTDSFTTYRFRHL
jgi:hypothetical protein